MAKKSLTKAQMQEPVKVTCYRETKTYKTRKEAIDFYSEGMCCCDPGSSEFERYATIVMQLEAGHMSASDE